MCEKILIVDGHQSTRETLKSYLLKAGYESIFEASDGGNAVRIYFEINPELVVLDVSTPEMDGLETLKTIKNINADAKVIMLGSASQKSQLDEAMKLGAVGYVYKPLNPVQFLKSVTSII